MTQNLPHVSSPPKPTIQYICSSFILNISLQLLLKEEVGDIELYSMQFSYAKLCNMFEAIFNISVALNFIKKKSITVFIQSIGTDRT